MSLVEYLPSSRLALTGVGLVVTLVLLQWWRQSRTLATIPSPDASFFMSRRSGLPPRAPEVFRQWAREYGELFKLRIGWYNWVVINSPAAFKEIFDKQVSALCLPRDVVTYVD